MLRLHHRDQIGILTDAYNQELLTRIALRIVMLQEIEYVPLLDVKNDLLE